MGRARRRLALGVLSAVVLGVALPHIFGIALAAAINFNVHVHDDYYHPVGAFLVGGSTDHNLAKAACQLASPDPACDAVIYTGDTITWVAPAPLAANTHTVTECTDGTFAVCGPAVSAANPIGDSGFRSPPPAVAPAGWPYGPISFSTPGTYYYRCEVHPDVMRGRIVVQAPPPVGGISIDPPVAVRAAETPATSESHAGVMAMIIAGSLAGTAALGGGALYLRRRSSR